MWHLLLYAINNSTLFEGPEFCKQLSLEHQPQKDRLYYEAGRIVCMSLVHGGPAPNFFSDILFNHITQVPKEQNLKVTDINDHGIRPQMEAIQSASDITTLQSAYVTDFSGYMWLL